WLTHNTYRTQTSERSPAPAYSVNVVYSAGIDQITVLTPTISLTPTAVSPPIYTFSYHQEWYQPVITLSLVSEVGNLQPGEVRQVAAGAEIHYTLPTGSNVLMLPPLYVTGATIADLTPAEQTAVPGQTISYTLALLNPAATADTYTLAVNGLPSNWGAAFPGSANVPGNGQAAVTLALTVPDNADLHDYPFIVAVTTGSGGTAQLGGTAIVQEGVRVMVTAVTASLAPIGQPISHTLTITNLESTARTYALSAAGAPIVTLPPQVTVDANGSTTVLLTAAPSDTGQQAFTVNAVAQESGAAGSDTAVIQGLGADGVAVSLTPSLVETGPGGTAVLTVTLQNLSSSAHTFNLDSTLPANWNGRFEANGQPINAIFIATGIYNTAQVTLLVNPAETAVSGSYPISVMAASQTNLAANGTANGQIDLNGIGVQVQILDQNMTINPNQSFSWDVRVTNTGENSDTFTLAAAGLPVGANGTFSSDTVTLAAGEAVVVQYTAGPFSGALPQAYDLNVMAQSGANTAVYGEDRTTFTLAAQEAVSLVWLPANQTITNTFATDFTLVLTNTGNTAATFTLNLSGAGLTFAVPLNEILLPPAMTAVIPVTVQANGTGSFVLTGTAVGSTAQASDTASLTVATTGNGNDADLLYLPIIVRHP
ncbi:MAG: hypothetical protein KC443_08480, partial [Anaerolineales bacterium]|nr:hypothetical protein [Anaerolineales bacterium]